MGKNKHNGILPDRALNMIYFFFILSSFYLMLTVLNYLKEKYNFQISYTSFTKQFLGFYLLITMFSGTPLFLAYHDLLIGKAYKYNQEMKVRFHSIIETKEKKITVPALINKPTTLYSEVIMGLTTDKNNWKNLELSRFYNKEILVQPTDSVVTE